jgi:RNA-directed DNA polymerase
VNELKSPDKPFDIPKTEVWDAWLKVKANKGAPGVDGCTIEEFEKDLKGNLYKIWNRMSSGSYFRRQCVRWKYQNRTGPECGF